MIDDRQTCDVCGEDFNEERPHHEHVPKEKKPGQDDGAGVDASEKATDDGGQS